MEPHKRIAIRKVPADQSVQRQDIVRAVKDITDRIKEDFGLTVVWTTFNKLDVDTAELENTKKLHGFHASKPSRFSEGKSEVCFKITTPDVKSFCGLYSLQHPGFSDDEDRKIGFRLIREDGSPFISSDNILSIMNGMLPVINKAFPIFAPGDTGLQWLKSKAQSPTNCGMISQETDEMGSGEAIGFSLPKEADVSEGMLVALAGIYHSIKTDGKFMSPPELSLEPFGILPDTAKDAATALGEAHEFNQTLQEAGVRNPERLMSGLYAKAMRATNGRQGGRT